MSDELDQDFLYISSLKTGLGSNDIGLDRGKLGKQRIVKFKDTEIRFLLIQLTLKYRANSDNTSEKEKRRRGFCIFCYFWF